MAVKGNHAEIAKTLIEAFSQPIKNQDTEGDLSPKIYFEEAPNLLDIRNRTGQSAYAIAKATRQTNYKKITQLYNQYNRPIEIDKIVVQRIALGHAWEIAGKSAIRRQSTAEIALTIDLEGHYSAEWYHLMETHLRMLKTPPFFNEFQNISLINLFNVGAHPKKNLAEESLQRIQAGIPTFLSSGYKNHEAVVFIWQSPKRQFDPEQESLFALCNRGGGSRYPIEIYHMGKDINIDVLLEIEKVKVKGVKDYKKLFYSHLPEKLELYQTALDCKLNASHPLPDQVIGNCSFSSPTTAVFAFLLLSQVYGIDANCHLGKAAFYNEDQILQNIKKATSAYQAWLSNLQIRILEINLLKRGNYELDHQLILKALRKANLLPLSLDLKDKLKKLTAEYLNTLDYFQRIWTTLDLQFWAVLLINARKGSFQ